MKRQQNHRFLFSEEYIRGESLLQTRPSSPFFFFFFFNRMEKGHINTFLLTLSCVSAFAHLSKQIDAVNQSVLEILKQGGSGSDGATRFSN